MEMLDIYDKRGKHIGTMERHAAHDPQNKGVYHKGVHIWIVNDKNEVLVQLRAKAKADCPDQWDVSCAGHVDAGETLLETCQRELAEELGLKSSQDSFIYKGELLGRSGNELHQLYLLRLNVEIKDMKLAPPEVADAKWLSLKDFEKLLFSKKFVAHAKNYKKFVLAFLKDSQI